MLLFVIRGRNLLRKWRFMKICLKRRVMRMGLMSVIGRLKYTFWRRRHALMKGL